MPHIAEEQLATIFADIFNKPVVAFALTYITEGGDMWSAFVKGKHGVLLLGAATALQMRVALEEDQHVPEENNGA